MLTFHIYSLIRCIINLFLLKGFVMIEKRPYPHIKRNEKEKGNRKGKYDRNADIKDFRRKLYPDFQRCPGLNYIKSQCHYEKYYPVPGERVSHLVSFDII